jgi:hypothetical protein
VGRQQFVVWDKTFCALLARTEFLKSSLRAPDKIMIAVRKKGHVWSLLIFNVDEQYLLMVRKASTVRHPRSV